jgi:hypothetical protein
MAGIGNTGPDSGQTASGPLLTCCSHVRLIIEMPPKM